MAYRRGFKTEANDLVAQIRRELTLSMYEQLDPLQLAAYLEIPVLPLSTLTEAPTAIAHFMQNDSSCFSAVTVFDGKARIIVHNDSHAATRQANNLAHELAHALLLHPATPALDERGCRHWDDDVEDEADFLGGALLVPEVAALTIARKAITFADAANHYGVSEQLMRWRLNVTGAYMRIQRQRRRFGG